MQLKAILGIFLIKLGFHILVGNYCGNLAIGLGNSSVLDLVTLKATYLDASPLHEEHWRVDPHGLMDGRLKRSNFV